MNYEREYIINKLMEWNLCVIAYAYVCTMIYTCYTSHTHVYNVRSDEQILCIK